MPYCGLGDVQIIDPTDCRKYYVCLAEGPPDPGLHFECDPGESFDIAAGRCLPGAECNILCGGWEQTTPGIALTTPSGGASTSGGGSTTTSGGVSSTEPPMNCVSSIICQETGLVAACDGCSPDYFSCQEVGQPGISEECAEGLVFNPNPSYPYCVLPTDCPK